MRPLKLVLADDHDIVIEGLRRILQHKDFVIAGCVSCGEELISAVENLKPDVVVTDVTMPGMNGLEAVKLLLRKHPNIRVVFISMHSDIAYANEATALGNCAYVLKTSTADDLPDAIRAVARGEKYYSPAIARGLLENSPRDTSTPPQTKLSVREKEILQLLAEGKVFKDIAAILNISPRTVEFHRNRIAEKTGNRTTADLTRYAIRTGIISKTIVNE